MRFLGDTHGKMSARPLDLRVCSQEGSRSDVLDVGVTRTWCNWITEVWKEVGLSWGQGSGRTATGKSLRSPDGLVGRARILGERAKRNTRKREVKPAV